MGDLTKPDVRTLSAQGLAVLRVLTAAADGQLAMADVRRLTPRGVSRCETIPAIDSFPSARSAATVPRLIHGRRTTYQAYCRCLPCTAANAAYVAHLRHLAAHGRQPLGILVPAGDT